MGHLASLHESYRDTETASIAFEPLPRGSGRDKVLDAVVSAGLQPRAASVTATAPAAAPAPALAP
jgi:hypothetical protein